MKTLRKLCDELNKTIIIVLHDINFAASFSDFIVALKNGNVQYYDKTSQVIREEVLEEIFEIPFRITLCNNRKICNYYI